MTVTPTPFKTILVANRGEIACRIMRTAKELGLESVAAYSESDAGAPHVKMADKAYLLGPAPAADSYLNQTRILDAASATGAGAIHPGYGFLSENAGFAKACAKAGIIFIGPDPDAIALMGDKANAKRRMIAVGVPCIPGYQGEDQSDKALASAAEKIGFPIMLKAAAGGGGRGMRLVENNKDLSAAIQTARSEAQNAFGSDDLILERAINDARHVEIQIFADRCGNIVHMGERDCSVQRRHQKVLEEAPCPAMTPALREAMAAAAVKAAKDINYVGAGTVEFLLDAEGGFYFLEMNTRLQVEHPVTEMVTGIDLVALQIRVAQGKDLGFSQDEISLKGHAIEARLYAEDVAQDFLPTAGNIDLWQPDENIRVDAGIQTGDVVSPYYDPMLAKFIAHGATRNEARLKLVEALKNTALFGVSTNRKFLIDALEKPAFAAGKATTGFIAKAFSDDDFSLAVLSAEEAGIAALLLHNANGDAARAKAVVSLQSLNNWTSASKIITPYRFAVSDGFIDVGVTPAGAQAYDIAGDGQAFSISVIDKQENSIVLDIGGRHINVLFNQPLSADPGSRIQFTLGARDFDLQNLNAVFAASQETASAGDITAPMHGMLAEIFVKPGQKISKGERLAVLEAMKMQHELRSETDGEVAAIHAAPGGQVAAGALLIEIKQDE